MSDYKRYFMLIGGDFLVILAVVWVGRLSHAQNIWDVGALFFVAAPFLVAWFVVMPWMGVYQRQPRGGLWLRLLLGWGVVGCPMALMLRSVMLERPIIAGIVPTFAVVMLVTTTTALMVWRMGYIGWERRNGTSSLLSSS